MTVFRSSDRKAYRYDFCFNGRRHQGSTKQVRKADAELWESKLKLQLRQQLGGVASLSAGDTPAIQEWAEIYYTDVEPRLRHPERVADILRVVLRFWGRKPARATAKNRAYQHEPYHDLHLGDPIADPYWVVRFEAWMAARQQSGQTRNQYRSTLSQLFDLAMQPAYRARTGVILNPFRGIRRDPPRRRVTTVSVDELRAWLAAASYHVRLAMGIAALAPTLRLGNILALTWAAHLDRDLTRITVPEHKTMADTGQPLVVLVSAQLRAILLDARRRSRRDHPRRRGSRGRASGPDLRARERRHVPHAQARDGESVRAALRRRRRAGPQRVAADAAHGAQPAGDDPDLHAPRRRRPAAAPRAPVGGRTHRRPGHAPAPSGDAGADS